jgi:hypothetical protein
MGQLVDPEIDMIRMKITKCQGEKCMKEDEISQRIENININVYTFHFYIDLSLREKPILSKIKLLNSDILQNSRSKIRNAEMMINKFYAFDHILTSR